MQTILVIDDDENLREMVGILLEREGFHPILAADGQTGLDHAALSRPALILADLRLPDISGVEICKRVRASAIQTPIIVLSAVCEEVEKVLLLELGADDYVVKPFGARELVARIRAVLRRLPGEPERVLSFGETRIDLDRRIVVRQGQQVKLTPAEYNLLTFFLRHPGRPLSRDLILNSVWGYESFPSTRTVDAHVGRLRQKLEEDTRFPRHFLTVSRVGYRFQP